MTWAGFRGKELRVSKKLFFPEGLNGDMGIYDWMGSPLLSKTLQIHGSI